MSKGTSVSIVGGGSGGSGSITIGTTTITSGTNTRVLFDDNGVIGEDTGLTYAKASGTLVATILSGNLIQNNKVNIGTGTGTAKIGGILASAAPSQATTGTSPEVLASVSIPANTLVSNGDTLLIDFYVNHAANANSKVFQIKLNGTGGTLVFDTGADSPNNLILTPFAVGRLTRTGATTAALALSVYKFSNSTTSLSSLSGGVHSYNRSLSVTWANANTLDFIGTTGTSAGDLTLISYRVEYLPANP